MDKKNRGWEDLKIYKVSFELSIKLHKLSLLLPNYEKFEVGSQIRRSSKSITANIVEGNGRTKYKNDYIKFLIYALASCNETISHLKVIQRIHPEIINTSELISEYKSLGSMIYRFIDYIERNFT